MIHLERVILPEGLRALAYRDTSGNLVIYVSETLDAAHQRAAVMQAIRATRRAGWRAGLPSAGIALLAGLRVVLGRAAGGLRLRPVAWGAAATTAALGASAAAVFVTAVPHHHAPSASGRQPGPGSAGAAAPRGQRPAHASRPIQAKPVASSGAAPASAKAAAAGKASPASSGGSSPAPAPAPVPAPVPGPVPAQPTPSPSPSGGVCVIVLGVRVCVPSASASVGS